MRHQDFRQSRRRDFAADTFYPQPRSFGTRPRFTRPRFEALPGHPSAGSSSGSTPRKALGSSNFPMAQVTPFFMEACWPRAALPPFNREKPWKFGLAPARHRGVERRFEHRYCGDAATIELSSRTVEQANLRYAGRGDRDGEMV